MIRPIAAVATLALLAACATPQEQCIAQASKDITTVRALIAETEATLARGYALETRETVQSTLQFCGALGRGNGDLLFCQVMEPVQTQTPVTIDARLEKQKLAQLRAKEAELSRGYSAALAQCRARYPN